MFKLPLLFRICCAKRVDKHTGAHTATRHPTDRKDMVAEAWNFLS